jgi:hypothetical protein
MRNSHASFRRLARQFATLGVLAIAACVSGPLATAGGALPAVRQDANPPGRSPQSGVPSEAEVAAAIRDAATAHEELQQTLESIVSSRQQMMQTIESNDLEAFRSQAAKIQDQLAFSRRTMDRAVLNGDWREPQKKRKAAVVADSMQGAQILSLMTVAISSGYEYPTKKIPDSAADAAVRLFDRIERLALAVKALNQRAR